jgi:zinc protease
VLQSVTQASLTPWEDRTAGRSLLDKPPTPGTIVSRRSVDAIGATVLKLSNGVEVWLKRTDFKNDQVLFGADAIGGVSVAEPARVFEALLAPMAVGEMGIGGFTPVEIEKLMAGKLVQVTPEMQHYTHGLSGSSTPGDLETALQLLYLEFTAPDDRAEGFEVLRKRLATAVAHRESDPGSVYGDAISALNTGGHYMHRPLKPEDVTKLDREEALRFYRASFANAADFRFVFVGAFDPAVLEPLVARYIGALPSAGKPTSHLQDRGLKFPQGVKKLEVHKGREPRASTTLTFYTDAGESETERAQLQVAVGVLRNRLRGLLREEMSGTYGVGVSYSDMRPLPGYGTITVNFGSSPENAPKLGKAVLDEIDRLQLLGPNAQEVAHEQEIERRELEVAERQNGYWFNAIRRLTLLGRDPSALKRRRQEIDAVSPERLQIAYRRYFLFGRYTQVTLLPEPAAAPAAGGS